jgi:hypothetical protein
MAAHDGTGTPVDPPDDANHVTPLVLPVPTGTPPAVDFGLLGQTKFATLFNSLTNYQYDEQTLESRAAKTILEAAVQCR